MPDKNLDQLRQGPDSPRSPTKVGIASILIGLMANAFAANIADSLLAQPDGARIRPMAEALALVFAACLGICGAALAVVPLRENSTRRIGLVGLILGLTPFPMGVALMKAAIRARHLILLP